MNDPPNIGDSLSTTTRVDFRLGVDRNNITFPVFDVDSGQVALRMLKLPELGRFVDSSVHVGAPLSASAAYVYEFTYADAHEAAAQLNLLNLTRGDSTEWISTTVELEATDQQGATNVSGPRTGSSGGCGRKHAAASMRLPVRATS